MITIIVEKNNDIYTREIKTFKRKGIRYYLFKIYSRLINRKYEVVQDGRKIKRTRKRK